MGVRGVAIWAAMRALLFLLCGMLTVACVADGDPNDASQAATWPAVRVGSGPDTETVLLSEVTALLLMAEDVDAEVVRLSDPRDARRALGEGRIDVRPAYTGEEWLEALGRADPPGSPEASFAAVREHGEEAEITWLEPAFGSGVDEPPADATFAFVVSPSLREEGVETVSQLAARLSERPDAALCVDHDFAVRTDGLRAVLSAYSVRSDQPVLAADPQDAAAGVLAGDCIAGLTTATDPAAWSLGTFPLDDDLGVFPAFVIALQVRSEVIEERPQIATALEPFARHLSTRLVGGWNGRILAGEPVSEVARDAAEELRLLAGREARSLGD